MINAQTLPIVLSVPQHMEKMQWILLVLCVRQCWQAAPTAPTQLIVPHAIIIILYRPVAEYVAYVTPQLVIV